MFKFIKSVKTELSHVVWLNKKQTIMLTISVIVASVLVAYYLGLFDIIFSKLLRIIIS